MTEIARTTAHPPADQEALLPPGYEELPSNWGRWGQDDDLGTLNLITDEARARGAAEARTGRVVSLAHPVDPVVVAGGRPGPPRLVPMPAPLLQTMVYVGSPSLATVDTMTVTTHHVALTHIDALGHVTVDGRVYPGVPLDEATAGGTLNRASTTAFVDGVVTRGVLLDLAVGGRLDPATAVTAADLEEAETRSGVRVTSGDALVVRGGWTRHLPRPEPAPWLSLGAVLWMADRGVGLIASDIGDRPPQLGEVMPLHAVALARLGTPLVDNAAVDALGDVCAELDRWSFLFTLGAPPFRGLTGVPVNPLAVF
ncbi:cyclase family protein [Umezawaea tangerina]|uniref:Kynurenine formamidase n=1 Tax=Umezawaea tangerina TaxID=84725 RepID=A0A2T0STL2_9PSEU|nr:cyclase family protein [Umezawaea tangerina]PRY36740.1 kynurenine formamidase [Umezawaea tangerina]